MMVGRKKRQRKDSIPWPLGRKSSKVTTRPARWSFEIASLFLIFFGVVFWSHFLCIFMWILRYEKTSKRGKKRIRKIIIPLFLSLAYTHTHTLSLIHGDIHTLTLSHANTLSLSHGHKQTDTHTLHHTYTHTLHHTYTHSPSHTYTHSLSLPFLTLRKPHKRQYLFLLLFLFFLLRVCLNFSLVFLRWTKLVFLYYFPLLK